MIGHTQIPWFAERRDWKGEESPHKIYISGGLCTGYGDDDEEDGIALDPEPWTAATAVCIVEGNATSREVTKANAEFLVRACNNHDRLVSMLRELAEQADDFACMYQDMRNRIRGKGIEPEHCVGHPEIHQMTMDHKIEKARALISEIEKEQVQ